MKKHKGLRQQRSSLRRLRSLERPTLAHGFMYLGAILDVASRKVLAFRLSNTMTADFCVEALEEALAKFGRPEIFNTDQGSQFAPLHTCKHSASARARCQTVHNQHSRITAPDSEGSDGIFGQVGIDGEPTVVNVSDELRPFLEQITERIADAYPRAGSAPPEHWPTRVRLSAAVPLSADAARSDRLSPLASRSMS